MLSRGTRAKNWRRRERENVTKRTEATCDDCYFRREGLCALALERACPTFRAARGGELERPRQPRLIPLPAAAFAPAPAAA
jgi:hypothetical protein